MAAQPSQSLEYQEYPMVIKHGWLGNPLSINVLVGTSLVSGHFPLPCLMTPGGIHRVWFCTADVD